MKEHILFIIDGLPGGGAENVTLALAKGVQQRGYHVTLLSLSNKRDYEIPAGIDFIVDADRGSGPLRKLTELSRRAASLDAVLSELFARVGQPTLVISNLHKTDRIVVRSKILRANNVWHCIHGMFSRSYLGNKTGLSRWLKRRKMQHVYKNRQLITVSDAVGEDVVQQMGIKPAQLITIYNPFDIPEIERRAAAVNPFAGEDYILHVGRFHQVKRHDRLLEAFALAQLPGKLVLIGQGEESVTQAITAKIAALQLQDKVLLAGFQQNPLPAIKGAKIVALSSDSEGLPTVLIEALICHTPIVSTQSPGGVAEIMSGELAPYMSAMSAQSLAEKLRLAWETPPEIVPAMYRKFDYEHIIDKYLSLVKRP
ncbi:glycosyltransferase [Serratia rubidaea]|uniref:glycosyltransferase n=1 Tax=Serratia rubidaea TaxID=61652 RepID=UPI001F35769A|nr:glycosyltransferase [Serratia rubidaea]UJD82421.1 glycosyltransferase [Serratia rubidaea]UJD86985.1 glycosyltransferase [Serratia rubidaea]